MDSFCKIVDSFLVKLPPCEYGGSIWIYYWSKVVMLARQLYMVASGNIPTTQRRQIQIHPSQRQIHRQRQKSSAGTFLYFAKISILTILSAFHNLKVPFRITFLLVNHSSVNRDLPSLEVARPSIPIEIAGVSIPSL